MAQNNPLFICLFTFLAFSVKDKYTAVIGKTVNKQTIVCDRLSRLGTEYKKVPAMMAASLLSASVGVRWIWDLDVSYIQLLKYVLFYQQIYTFYFMNKFLIF